MGEWVLIFFVILLLLTILIYNIVNQNEDKALYYPSKKRFWKPKVNYKSVYINVKDSRDVVYNAKDRREDREYISGWHFDNFKGAKTICFSHGNTGNISHREYIIRICMKFKMNLLVYDYRGFGESSSSPNKIYLREDGELAYEYLHYNCNIPHKQIIVWGESLGGIAAVWTANKYKCGGLILICTFSSLDDAISYQFKGASKSAVKFLTSLLSYKVDMVPLKEYLTEVECPVVIIHSNEDDMIPYACSWINYHSVKHSNKLHVRIKGGHASPDIKSDQLREIFEFCDLSLDDLSSDINISDMLENLRTVAEKYNHFIDSD